MARRFNYDKAKKMGYSDEEIQAYLAKSQPTTQPQPQQQLSSPAQSEDDGGFIGNIFEDVGGIASGLIGLPGVAVDILTGKRDLGDTANQVVHGTIQEYTDLATKPVETIYEKPVTSALNVLPFVGGAASKLSKLAKGSKVADTVADAGKTGQILNKAKTAGKVAGEPSQVAKNVYQSVLNFSKKNRAFERLKPNETVGAMIKDRIWGTPDTIAKKAEMVTGNKGIVSQIVNNAVADTKGTINIQDFFVRNNADDYLGKYTYVKPDDVNEVMVRFSNIPAGKKPFEIDLSRLLDEQRKLAEEAMDHKIDSLKGDVRARELGDFKMDLADDLNNMIDEAVKGTTIQAYKTPQVIQFLKDNVSPEFAKRFENAKTLKELRSIQSPYVRMRKMVQLANEEPSSLGNMLMRNVTQIPVVGPVVDSIGKYAATPVATGLAVASDAAAPMAGKVGQVAGSMAANTGKSLPYANMVGQSLNDGAMDQPEQDFAGAIFDDSTTQDMGMDVGNQLGGNPDTSGQQEEVKNGMPKELINALIAEDMVRTGGKNVERFTKIREALYGKEDAVNLKTSQLKELSDLQDSINVLEDVEAYIGENSSAMGPVRGRFGEANPYDTSAQAFDSQMNFVTAMIAKGMEGGRMSDQDILRYRKMLPNITDTKPVALRKINQIRRMLMSKYSTKSKYYMDTPSMSDTSTESLDGVFSQPL